jgi:DNA-directed RNA polymerase subunit M/transcription elongation factor TFIIS
MKRKKKGVRVIPHKQKTVQRPFDCPACGKGFVKEGVYVGVATEEADEERTRYLFCTNCDWRLFDD